MGPSARSGRVAAALLLTFAGLWHAAPARAAPQPPAPAAAPSDAATAEAMSLYAAGRREFNLGNYDEALALFEKAYKAKPVYRLLYNIAHCHRLLGHLEQARRVYKAFILESPANEPNLGVAKEKLAEVEKTLAAQARVRQSPPAGLAGVEGGPAPASRPAAAGPPAPALPAPAPDLASPPAAKEPVAAPAAPPAASPAEAAPAKPVEAAPAKPVEAAPPKAVEAAPATEGPKEGRLAAATPAPPESPPVPEPAAPAPPRSAPQAPAASVAAAPPPSVAARPLSRTLAWVGAGLGAAALAGGGAAVVLAKGTADQISGSVHTRDELKDLNGKLSTQNAAATALLVGGGALLATAAALYFLQF